MHKEAIELRHLRYFAALAEELSFGRAAARCHVSQPPFSVAIQQLESFLGVTLVTRSSRSVELTESGRQFYQRAVALIGQANASFDEVRRFDGTLAHRFNVGFHASMLYRGLGDAISAFRSQFPDVRVSLHEMSSMSQLDGIQRGELDVGFTHSIVPHQEQLIDCTTLFNERFMLCAPKHFNLPDEPLDLARLKDENFILFNRSASPYYFDTILSLCVAAGFSPRIEHRVSQWLTAVSAVSMGIGVAIVPECLATTGIGGVIFRDIETTVRSPVQYLVAKDANPQYSTAMLELARRYIRPSRVAN